jgi:hypothetical protein
MNNLISIQDVGYFAGPFEIPSCFKKEQQLVVVDTLDYYIEWQRSI